MKDLVGYEFFTIRDGVPFELDPAYGSEYAQLFNTKVATLAWDLKLLLAALEAEGTANEGNGRDVRGESQAPSKPAVYLAECGYDRKQARELIEGELKRLGYPVLPDRQMPVDEAEYIAAVESLLARCALSIHLVGESPGAGLDGPTGKSTVTPAKRAGSCALQERWPQAADLAAAGGELEAGVAAGVYRGAAPGRGSAVRRGPDRRSDRGAESRDPRHLEEDRAARTAAIGTRRQRGAGRRWREYEADLPLICDERDRKASVPVRKLCKQHGFDVALPAFEGDASEVRKANQQLLATCDAVLCFTGPVTTRGNAPSTTS